MDNASRITTLCNATGWGVCLHSWLITRRSVVATIDRRLVRSAAADFGAFKIDFDAVDDFFTAFDGSGF